MLYTPLDYSEIFPPSDEEFANRKCIPLGFGAGLVAGWAGSKAGADAGDAINDMAGW